MPFLPTTQSLNDQQQWIAGQQSLPHPYSEQLANVGLFGLGLGALHLVGKHQFTPTKRGYDYYVNAIRHLEEYSPGRVFRTFQLSHLFSGLETLPEASRFISPGQISELRRSRSGRIWLDQLTRTIGSDLSASGITAKGLRFQQGKVFLGQTDQILLKHASIIRSTAGASPSFQTAYARSLKGGPLLDQFHPSIRKAQQEVSAGRKAFAQAIQFTDEAGNLKQDVFMIAGGQTRFQAAKRMLFGYGTSLTERFNQLMRSPFEIEPFASVFQKAPILKNIHFDVIPSSGLKTYAKLGAKLGIGGTLAYLGYQELDYRLRQSELFDNTLFSEGITIGAASLWTKGQLALSKSADYLGLHDYRERQEEIAPGSTNLTKLAAFPIMGGMSGLGYEYGRRIYDQLRYQRKGLDISQIGFIESAKEELFKSKLYGKSVELHHFGLLDDSTKNLVEMETDKLLSSWRGRISKSISRRQKSGGILNVLGKMTPGKLSGFAGLAAGLALISPYLPGALVPSDRPEKLQRLYSGEEQVAIKKGRWWEAGGSPIEGQRVDRYQDHWFPSLFNRGKDVSIYGDDISPFKKFYLANFTYELEKQHYSDRPYPQSSPAFSEIPLIGPILGATIGRLVKPVKYMHTEEFTRPAEEGLEYKRTPLSFGETINPYEKEPGAPISRYGVKGTLNEQTSNFLEMVGLPGFVLSSIKEKVTGTQDLFDQEQQMASFGKVYSPVRSWWDRELGGLAGTSEPLRRLLPRDRRRDVYNPIPNAFANVDWLPGEGERSVNFKIGDPYTAIPEGETRLPGRGYEATRPHLRGLDPNDYPLIEKYSILADVASYTDKFKEIRGQMRGAIKRGELSPEELERYKTIEAQVKSKRIKKEFNPYLYRDKHRTPVAEMLAQANQAEKENDITDSWFNKVVGGYWETVAHGLDATPTQFLTPFRPAHKLLHMRTATEDYERMQVYGKEMAMWNKPGTDFLRPFFDSMANALGSNHIPDHIEKKRGIEEYFDMLSYVKHTRLKRQAQIKEDQEAIAEHEQKRRETLFGIDPYTYNYSSIYRALPRSDRDYFADFVEADMEEREKIWDLVPENEKPLFLARWKLEDAKDMQKAIKQGLLSEEQVDKAESFINEMYREREVEGFPKTEELWTSYLKTRLQGESYPDWYRRTILLEKNLAGRELPGPDWVGWQADFPLDLIKLKVVENEGENMYEYDLWPNMVTKAARVPQLEEITEELYEGNPDTPEEIREKLRELFDINGMQNAQISIRPVPGLSEHKIDLEVEENRTMDLRQVLRKQGLLSN